MARASPQKDFTIHKSAAHDARSKLCDQIGEALRLLKAHRPSNAEIHEARKAIKRSRATLRLLRDTLSNREYRLDNATLRDAAKPLSIVRDARVLVETLDDLVARERLGPEETTAFRAVLDREQRDVRRDGDGTFDRSRASLHEARNRIARSNLDSRGWSDLGDGLQRVYARGRRALRASRAKCTTKCLHEW